MILADKIINLRKKAGLSQEELAYKLNVSRQSVSKWEGALSVPDINKIIEMSKLFGVSTDYLLKDEIEDVEYVEVEDELDDNSARKVSMEEAVSYLETVKRERIKIASGVFLCITSPIPLFVFGCLNDNGYVSDQVAGIIGLVYLFVSIAVAVGLFIVAGINLDKYEYLQKEVIDTAYGVSGMVKEKQREDQQSYNHSIVYATVLCVLAVVPLLVLAFFENDIYLMIGLCTMFLMIGIAVFIFIYKGMVRESFKCLLQEGEHAKAAKRRPTSVGGAILGSYWTIVAAVYLLISFLTKGWHLTWIIFVVAAAFHPILRAIIIKSKKNKEE